MATVWSTYATARPDLAHALAINGRWRTDCFVADVRLTLGAGRPSSATIVFPDAVWGETPVSRGDSVAAYLDTGLNGYGNPDFVGTIDGVDDEYSKRMVVAYTAFDLRMEANRRTVWRDFNVPDSATGRRREALSYAAIARMVIDWVNDNAGLGYDIELSTGGLSTAPAPAQYVRGTPIGDFLDALLADAMNENGANWRLRYGTTVVWLDVRNAGTGIHRRMVPASDATVAITSQEATTNEIQSHEGSERMATRVIVEGAPRIVQRLWELTPGWPDTVGGVAIAPVEYGGPITIGGVAASEVLYNWDRFATARMSDPYTHEDIPNPEYVHGAENVGRRWKLPSISLYDPTTNKAPGEAGSTAYQYPEILPRLIDTRLRPFLLYRLPGDVEDAAWRVKADGFSIEGNRVVTFGRPFTETISDGITVWSQKAVPWTYHEKIEGEEPTQRTEYYSGAFSRAFGENELQGADIFLSYIVPKKRDWQWHGLTNFSHHRNKVSVFQVLAPEGAVPNWGNGTNRARYAQLEGMADNEYYRIVSATDIALGAYYLTVEKVGKWDESGYIAQWTSIDEFRPNVAYSPVLHTFTLDYGPDSWAPAGMMSISENLATGLLAPGETLFKVGDFAPFGLNLEVPTDRSKWIFDVHLATHSDPEFVLPSTVALVACYRDTVRPSYDTGEPSGEIEVQERVRRDEFQEVILEAGTPMYDGTGSVTGGASQDMTIVDDSEEMEAFAEARLATRNRPTVTHRAALPAFPSYLRPGDVASSPDRRFNGKTLTGVNYDCVDQMVTVECEDW